MDHSLRTLLAVALAVAALVIGPTVTAARADDGGYVTHSWYIGQRYKSPRICVQINTQRVWLRDRVREAVADLNDHTSLVLFTRSDCSAYGQRISIKTGRYGNTPWAGRVITTSHYWGTTPNGHNTWLVKAQRVELNLSHRQNWAGRDGDHIITHELTHAAGALRDLKRYGACTSVVESKCWFRETQAADRKAINAIYAQ